MVLWIWTYVKWGKNCTQFWPIHRQVFGRTIVRYQFFLYHSLVHYCYVLKKNLINVTLEEAIFFQSFTNSTYISSSVSAPRGCTMHISICQKSKTNPTMLSWWLLVHKITQTRQLFLDKKKASEQNGRITFENISKKTISELS